MTIVLGDNQYGKAETHLVRVTRDGATPEIKDITVTIALSGDFKASHTDGDNSNVVPTDTQKNTVFAFAKEAPVGEIEEFGLRVRQGVEVLNRHQAVPAGSWPRRPGRGR